MMSLSDEAKVFARMSIFGIVVGGAYWFLTYEVAEGESAETIPEPGWAPLIISLGVGGLALGAAFGPWLTIAGLLVTIAGGASWLSAAIREARSAHGSLPSDRDGG